MNKKTIDISSVEPLSFFGPNDQNLKFLEKNLSISIISRGDVLQLEGDESAIATCERVVHEMLNTIQRKSYVDSEDVNTLLNMEAGSEEDFDDEFVILHTPKGSVVPRTAMQSHYCNAVNKNDIVFSVGPAGTGKTFLAVAMAVAALKRKEIDRIVITRPVVEAGEKLGFLPGDMREKVDPYIIPIYEALNQFLPHDKLKQMEDRRIIEVAPLAYMRGRTLEAAFIILDEAQNATRMQMKMLLTRLGVRSKALITGDLTQMDLPRNEISGLNDAISILRGIDSIKIVEFSHDDVIRHKIVIEIIKAYGEQSRQNTR